MTSAAAGHDVENDGDNRRVIDHAGATVRHASRMLESAPDPRADGAVAAR